jgi:DNA-binding NtrC family response regulator
MLEAQPRRILLVEDEAIIALSEKMTVERNGLRVEMVHCIPNSRIRCREAYLVW